MSAVGATVQALLSDPAVTAIVGQRVFPLVLPQAVEPPALVVEIASQRDMATHLVGIGDNFAARVNVSSLTTDPASVLSLGEAVRASLHGRTGTYQGFAVRFELAENDMTDWNDDRTAFRRVVGFSVWWRALT